MEAAAAELLTLGADGLQLTPGNVPTPSFQQWLTGQDIPTRSHHGFSWQAMRRPVWTEAADCLSIADSLHPPRQSAPAAIHWWQRAASGDYGGLVLETMYPSYLLGDGAQLERAMDLGLTLAVDVAHIHIQRSGGVLSEAIWKRLMAYPSLSELHLSANGGTADIHQLLVPESFGLGWVRERVQDGVPVILECYLHRLSEPERRTQIELVRTLLAD